MKSKLRRVGLAGAWVLGVLISAGCGPGVGGTGTGGALDAFGAVAAPVCGGAVGAALDCAPATPGSGTLPLQFADGSGHVVLELKGNLARLDDACLKLRFDGEFGTLPSGAQAFFGSYEIADNGVDVLAALSIVPAAAGGLTIELRDANGRTILGPLLLGPVSTPRPPPAPC